jgi:phosphoribosylformimino-5-aminoimidazole carboxamide ribotide isomerase
MAARNPTPSAFEILPAVDLRAGRVVRLVRGDFEQETVYGADPAATAAAFAAEGARWLHVVDLDAARDPGARQADALAAILARVGERAHVEVAGGIRDEATAATILAAGAARVVLGTVALREPPLVGRLVARHGAEHIACALDVRDGRAIGHAWNAGAPGIPVEEALRALAEEGARTFEVTAIDRDGTLEGPDLALLGRLVTLGRGAIVASAGIASLSDLRAVRDLGCAGAIVGRALYEGRLALGEALEVGRG